MRPAESEPRPAAGGAPAAWDRKRVLRWATVGFALPVTVLGIGWAVLSSVEGWGGVVLWILLSLPLCVLAEILMRRGGRAPRSARSLPRMRVRVPARGDLDRARAGGRPAEPEFHWHREQTGRRRTHVGGR